MPANLHTRLSRIERRIAQRRQERRIELVYLDPFYFARQKLGFAPDPWQEHVLQWKGKQMLLNCSRQSGKSTVAPILALHRGLYFLHSLVLLISRSLRQSAELFKKVQHFLSLLPLRPKMEEDNKLSLQLSNGSRIVSLPGTEETIRGFSGPALIIEDEAARVSDSLYLAIRPMLAVSNGRLILMSTPWGKRGHFFEAWENGGSSWERITITAAECPRLSPEFLAEEKATMPDFWFKSEYGCQFTETLDAVFAYEHVMNALSDEVMPLGFSVPVDPHNTLDPSVKVLTGGLQ